MITYYPIKKNLEKNIKDNNDFIFTHSGKASICLILNFLLKENILQDKTSEIFINKWIGNDVYKTILNYCSINTNVVNDAKVMICYHQYGFPQKIDLIQNYCNENHIFLIEDCAHVLEGFYNNKKLGTFGDISFFSFSKFLYCGSLGGIKINNPLLKDNYTDNHKKIIKSSSKFLENFHLFQKYSIAYCQKKNFKQLKKILSILGRIFYGLSDLTLNPSLKSVEKFNCYYESELSLRREYKTIFFQEIKNKEFLAPIIDDKTTPYAIPLFAKNDILKKIKNKIQELNIECEIVNFDINKCLLNPKFTKCVLIPLSFASKENKNLLEDILDVINKV